MQFKYKFQIKDNDKIPMIDIVLRNVKNGKLTGYRALLDSGAYANIFHDEVAGLLGIDLSKIKEQEVFEGVEETDRTMKGKLYVLELMVMQGRKSHNFEAVVVFSSDISKRGFGLLGRQYFFDKFDEICFDYRKARFYLNIDT